MEVAIRTAHKARVRELLGRNGWIVKTDKEDRDVLVATPISRNVSDPAGDIDRLLDEARIIAIVHERRLA